MAGYVPGKDIYLAIDAASSEFYKDGRYHIENKALTAKQLIAMYAKWIKQFPIISIEDGSLIGGFGTSILEYISKKSINLNIKTLGIDDAFVTHGSRSELLDLIGLSVNKLYDKIKLIYEKK